MQIGLCTGSPSLLRKMHVHDNRARFQHDTLMVRANRATLWLLEVAVHAGNLAVLKTPRN